MGRLHKWQRGMADLVTAVVGMTIMSITVAGTSAAMIYGRQAMIRTEHFKTVAFRLRGTMEQMQAEIQLDTMATNQLGRRAARLDTVCLVDAPNDRNGSVVTCRITRGEVVPYQVYDFGEADGMFYYKVTAKAEWREFDDEESRSLEFHTSVFTREARSVRN